MYQLTEWLGGVIERLRADAPGRDPALERYAGKMAHVYTKGMEPGTMDEAQQETAIKRRQQRDREKGRTELRYSSPTALRRVG